MKTLDLRFLEVRLPLVLPPTRFCLPPERAFGCWTLDAVVVTKNDTLASPRITVMVASVMDLVNPKDPPAIANWITHDPSDDDAILDQLERSIPVRLIATLGEYTAAFADELAIDAENRATAHRFDFLPVRAAERGGVVGLFRRGAGRPAVPPQSAKSCNRWMARQTS